MALPLIDLGDSLVEPARTDVDQRLDPDAVHRGEVAHQGAGPLDIDPVLPAAVTDYDERKAAAEPDAEAPAPSPEAKPDMAAPVLEPSPAKP